MEEFISGKVASLHSVANFRNEDVYTFPLGNTFGNFTFPEQDKLIALAKQLHSHLGASHYLKSDFALNPRGKVYLLNIEFSPDFRRDSHLSQIAETAGVKTHQILEHILESVYN